MFKGHNANNTYEILYLLCEVFNTENSHIEMVQVYSIGVVCTCMEMIVMKRVS